MIKAMILLAIKISSRLTWRITNNKKKRKKSQINSLSSVRETSVMSLILKGRNTLRIIKRKK